MAGSTQSNLGGLILNVYSKDAIQKLQNLSSPLLAALKNAPSFRTGGNGFYFGVKTSGNEAFGFRSDTDALPTAGSEAVQQAVVPARVLFGTVEVTGLAKALATGQPTSFASVISFHLDEITDEMTSYMEGALFRDNTGKLGEVSAVNGTTVTLTSPGVLWLRDGMIVDFIDATGGSIAADVTLSNVDWVNNTVTVSSATGISNGDGVYLANTQDGATIAAKEFDGLASGTADSGTYLSISRTSYPRWKGNRVDAANTSLDEDLLARTHVRLLQESGSTRAAIRNMKIVGHHNQARKFAEVAYPRQRLSGTDVSLGVTALSYNGAEFMDTPFCPETTVFVGDISVFNKFVTENGDLQISSDFGQPWKFVSGYDAGRAYLRFYGNYAVRNPRRWAKIENLANVSGR